MKHYIISLKSNKYNGVSVAFVHECANTLDKVRLVDIIEKAIQDAYPKDEIIVSQLKSINPWDYKKYYNQDCTLKTAMLVLSHEIREAKKAKRFGWVKRMLKIA